MRAIIYSSVFIALAAAVLTIGTFYLFAPALSGLALGSFVFFATLALYNLDRLVGADREDRLADSRRHRWIAAHRRGLWALSGVGVAGLLASAPFLEPTTLVALTPLAALSVAYAVPLFGDPPWRRPTSDGEFVLGGFRLKELAGFKTALIALVWAAVTVVLPALEAGQALFDATLIWLFAERFVYIYALTLPFDIRDLPADREGGIKTVALLLGPAKTMALAMGLIGLFIAATAVGHVYTGDPSTWATAAIGGLTLIAFFPALKKARQATADDADHGLPELYYVGLLDGLLLLQGILLLLTALD